jgi:hypothetical protein
MARMRCFLFTFCCIGSLDIGAAVAAGAPAPSPGAPGAIAQPAPITLATDTLAAAQAARLTPDPKGLNLLAFEIKTADGLRCVNLGAGGLPSGCHTDCKTFEDNHLICVACCTCCLVAGVQQCGCSSDCIEI